jgi:hypothetical protein
MAIWYILWSFGLLSPVLVYCTKKNLATLQRFFNSFPRIVIFLLRSVSQQHRQGNCDDHKEKDFRAKKKCFDFFAGQPRAMRGRRATWLK